jgi:hypothetical protein
MRRTLAVMGPSLSFRTWLLAAAAIGAPALFLLWKPRPETGVHRAGTAPAAGPAEAPRREATVQTDPASADPSEGADAALRQLLSEPDPGRRLQGFFRWFAPLVSADPASALRQLRTVPPGAERTQGAFLLVQHLGIADPDGALAAAREFSSPADGGQLLSVLFSRWAQHDPAAALARWEALPADPARAAALRALVEAWARQDPPAALAWARGRDPGPERIAALEACLRELAARDPAAAIAEAASLPAGSSQERVLQQAFTHLLRRQPAEAARLLPALPPGDAQTLIVSDVARALAEQDIPGALAWSNGLAIDFTRWLALSSVLSVWAQRDAAAAARHVLELPPGPTLDYVAGQFVIHLAARPSEAIAWAEALGPSARDAAFVTLASAWAQSAPAEAVAWALALPAEPVRTNALAAAHGVWRALDPAGAQRWLDAAGLPPATRSRILAPR